MRLPPRLLLGITLANKAFPENRNRKEGKTWATFFLSLTFLPLYLTRFVFPINPITSLFRARLQFGRQTWYCIRRRTHRPTPFLPPLTAARAWSTAAKIAIWKTELVLQRRSIERTPRWIRNERAVSSASGINSALSPFQSL